MSRHAHSAAHYRNRPNQVAYSKGVTRADLERSFAALAGDELAELLDGLADWLERVRRR